MATFLEGIFGATILGIPTTPFVVGGFLCGVALFYLVMNRQRKRNAEQAD